MFKNKKIIPVVGLTVLVTVSLVIIRLGQTWPVAVIGVSPVSRPITEKQFSSKPANDTPSKLTQSQPSTKLDNSPAPSQPLSNTPESQKQTAIRQTTPQEHVYYPLMSANDPGYASDWAIQAVDAPAAWNISTGNGQTVVAVIDTGFALNHDDLKNNWYNNPGETGVTKLGDRCWTGTPQDKSSNNCDDDNNGYVDDWRGWNFSLGDNNPMAGRTNPSGAGVSHGTETAGLVGAAGNNSIGIATINWNTKIMPLQALSDDGPGYTSDIAAAVYYAVDNGADVISMSLGGSTFDPVLKAATDYAYAHNVVVVAAAGNCGTGTESGCTGLPAGAMLYPALNNHVIAVGATDSNNQRASFSSYGPGLDISAPGSGTINSPTWTPGNATSLYASSLYGTSFAAPQVASLASLIKSIRPNSSVDDINALILATASKPTSMGSTVYSESYGHGIIDAFKALAVAQSLNGNSTTPTLLQTGNAVSEHSYALSDTLSSGCKVTLNTYCTVWMHDNVTGFDRYLPYTSSGASGQSSWSWGAGIIPVGDWDLKAVQGDYKSSDYSLSLK